MAAGNPAHGTARGEPELAASSGDGGKGGSDAKNYELKRGNGAPARPTTSAAPSEMPALHVAAAREGGEAEVRALLLAGADVNTRHVPPSQPSTAVKRGGRRPNAATFRIGRIQFESGTTALLVGAAE